MESIGDQIKNQFEIFQAEKEYFIKDKKNIEYFSKNPLNTDRTEVLTKISAVNSKELNDIDGLLPMSDHIMKLNIDSRLQKKDLSVVDDIANITIRGVKYRMMNFASLYCNYHQPEEFPIYSDQHRPFIEEYIKTLNLPIDKSKIDDYVVRKQILDHIINRFFAGTGLNYSEARKFGWIYLDRFIQQARSNSKD